MRRIENLPFIPPGPGFKLSDYKQEPRRLLTRVIAEETELTIEDVITKLTSKGDAFSLQVAEMLKGSTSLNDLITVFDRATTKFQVDSLILAVSCAIDEGFEDYLAGVSGPVLSGHWMSSGVMV